MSRVGALGLLGLHLLFTAATYSLAGPVAEAFGARWALGMRVPLTVLTFLLLGYGRRGAFHALPAALRPRMLACGLLVVLNQSFFLHGMAAGTPPAHGAI
ncbi:hypothetical protein IIA16_05550, partial [bacterium]|nr:hypothetical protein [bacterium]